MCIRAAVRGLCGALLVTSCGGNGSSVPAGGTPDSGDGQTDAGSDVVPEVSPEADWILSLDTSVVGRPLSPALLGHYDLSGPLFAMDRTPGLVDAMTQLRFSEWRVGVGRWEIATRLLPTLSDGTSCASHLVGFPPQAYGPEGASDFDLMRERDWFTYTDGSRVTAGAAADDHRYALAYVRSLIDVAEAFGARPYMSVDLMPRALSAGKIPRREERLPEIDRESACRATYTNGISNARPEDADVFAQAVTDLVRRITEGDSTGGPRHVTHWEVWNEPEFSYFWDKSFEPDAGDPLGQFFQMAIRTLLSLDAYRAGSAHEAARDLRFGLGSFALADTAATVIEAFEDAPLAIPVDFFSFHAYDDDPEVVVDQIRKVAAARTGSTRYSQSEIVLAEWGQDLARRTWTPTGMDEPLHAATVLTLAVAAGLDRAHHAIFWQFYEQIPFGILGHDVRPLPGYHAFAMLSAVVGDGATLLPAAGREDGRLDANHGAFVATRWTDGGVRVFLINRSTDPHVARVVVDQRQPAPERVLLFDDPAAAPREVPPSETTTIPGRSLVLLIYSPV